MTAAEVLILTQSNLDMLSIDTGRYSQLQTLQDAAIQMIAREGVTLTEPYSAEDANLISMYTCYLFRKRATNEPMPRMLRWALNNRIFGGNADGS